MGSSGIVLFSLDVDRGVFFSRSIEIIHWSETGQNRGKIEP